MTELICLNLAYSDVVDLYQLRGLRNLQVLDLAGTKNRDLSPLLDLPKLKIVGLDYEHPALNDIRCTSKKLSCHEGGILGSLSGLEDACIKGDEDEIERY